MKSSSAARTLYAAAVTISMVAMPIAASAVDGTLTLKVHDETTEEPTITRMELFRTDAPNRRLRVRKTVPAGIGVVVDRQVELALPPAAYRFRMIRGPEYRIISGDFSLDDTSLDEHKVGLPRMVDMLQEGWISGDCCIVPNDYDLPIRMASEDLHVAATTGEPSDRPVPGRKPDDPLTWNPLWIRTDAITDRGLVIYNADDTLRLARPELPVQWLVAAAQEQELKVAIENPFAWPLPVWLASDRVDGFFVLGDWLRLDRSIKSVGDGRPPQGPTFGGPVAIGRWAEQIYWQLLDAGFRIPPLAGSGDSRGDSPIGYNRLYVSTSPHVSEADGNVSDAMPPETQEQWWDAAWQGRSVVTNGPLLRPRLAGQLPGHVFHARSGDALQLQPELNLAVRDPVDYLEVVLNGRIHYSARLDEFARAGGIIPKLTIDESSWVLIRVVTLHEDHFRAASSAPWYIDFDGRPRITAEAVEFFQQWLSEYETRLQQLPPDQVRLHVPFVKAARAFWAARKPSS